MGVCCHGRGDIRFRRGIRWVFLDVKSNPCHGSRGFWYRLFLLATLATVGTKGAEVDWRTLSLRRLDHMMTTSLHDELAGSEDSFKRLLDFEWDGFNASPEGASAPFVVCSAPGREHSRHLRTLAGGSSRVQTLYHRKGEPMCALVTLDHGGVKEVAADGAYSFSPLPHLAKLAPSVAITALKPDTINDWEEGEETGVPTAHNLLKKSRKEGGVVIVEVILTPNKRSQPDTDKLALLWKSQMDDNTFLAKSLIEKHFWGEVEESAVSGKGAYDDRMLRVGKSSRIEARKDASTRTKGRGTIESNQVGHEDRKRREWATLHLALGLGQGDSQGAGRFGGYGSGGIGDGVRSCRFSMLRHTASPDGHKILFHDPHIIWMEGDGSAGGEEGREGLGADACLSAMLSFLSLKGEVYHVTARSQSKTMNLEAAWVTQSGVEGYTPLWDEGLLGQDEIIAVADTGLDIYHCDFREEDGVDPVSPSSWDNPITDLSKRKVVQYIDFVDDFDEDEGHGTHVAGSVAGAIASTTAGGNAGDGMAFAGKLSVFDFGDSSNGNSLSTPDQVDDIMLEPAYKGGARVHSNSWDTLNTGYTTISYEFDRFVFTYPEFVVVVAAGNCGDIGDGDADCDGIGPEQSVLSPAQAKNVIAVGAAESGGSAQRDMDTVSYFSSRGPTPDGRIKPDIVAPGDALWSANADNSGETCAFNSRQGTSMSTPIVAGSAALVRQYFREGWYNSGSKNESLGFDPSAALVKAVLVNSAMPMNLAAVNPASNTLDITLEAPPDVYQGHGRVTLSQGLNVNSSVGLFFKDWETIGEGETLEYTVSLYEGADLDKELRVTLVWTDPYGAASSSRALIHDLDLVVISQSDGEVHYPNGLSSADQDNNVEKVTINPSVAEEVYTVRVSCGDLSETDVQYFAVVANGEFIKTNEPPDPPEPDDWLDLLSDASSIDLSWQLIVAIAVGVVFCCTMSCMCRRCFGDSSKRANRQNAHIAYQQSGPYRVRTRGGGTNWGGRSRDPRVPPQPVVAPSHRRVVQVDNPNRRPSLSGSEAVAGSQREGTTVPRPQRQDNAERSSPVLVPVVFPPEQTASSAPSGDSCPECGAQFEDVVALVDHVEFRHRGRATRGGGGGRSPPLVERKGVGGAVGETAAAAATATAPEVVGESMQQTQTPVQVYPQSRGRQGNNRGEREQSRDAHSSSIASGTGMGMRSSGLEYNPQHPVSYAMPFQVGQPHLGVAMVQVAQPHPSYAYNGATQNSRSRSSPRSRSRAYGRTSPVEPVE